MGSIFNKKIDESLQMNYFLFENYKKYLKMHSNSDLKHIQSHVPAFNNYSFCGCLNLIPSSVIIKKIYMNYSLPGFKKNRRTGKTIILKEPKNYRKNFHGLNL